MALGPGTPDGDPLELAKPPMVSPAVQLRMSVASESRSQLGRPRQTARLPAETTARPAPDAFWKMFVSVQPVAVMTKVLRTATRYLPV